MSCAPGKKYDKINNTCFTLDELIELCNAYNRYITKNKFDANSTLKTNALTIKVTPNKKYLLSELKKRFRDVCEEDEICITRQDFMNEIVRKEIKNEIINETHRPIGPEDPTQWFRTDDINNIIKQYEKKHNNFYFLGAVPADCDMIKYCSLYHIEYDKFAQQNINNLAVIFNLDTHDKPGSHWVALFIDLTGKIYYCDSTGREPNDYIMSTINNFINYYKKKHNRDPIYLYNKKEYQLDSSECGVYSCNFIIRILSGESFKNIVNDYLKFNEINSCRNVYFSNKPSRISNTHHKCDPSVNE